MSDTVQQANLITRAITLGDPDLATYRISRMSAAEVRAVCFELAKRAPNVGADESILIAAIEAAASTFSVSPGDVSGTTKRREVVDARHVVCYVGHLLGMTYTSIARFLGRDHTTVMYAVTRVGETRHLREIAVTLAGSLGWDREAAS